jgi:hypothetical protein
MLENRMDEKVVLDFINNFKSWADMEQFDSSLYRRMIRDCIKKGAI